jgi:hypothetical protein
VTLGLRIVALLAVVACRDRPAEPGAKKSPLETAIARELTARFSAPVTAECAVMVGMTARCEAHLADGTKLPIAVTSERSEWVWRVNGIVVEQSALTEFVQASLAELHLDQKVDCSPAVHVLAPGDRTTCKLSGGGLAFVQIAADGNARLELALDGAAAAARGEPVTPQRDQELLKISRDLDGRAGATDGEEEVGRDAGAEEPGDGGV